ncbi:hypothetical protein BB561_001021 [Smittium simulii]|uniref:Extracellular membrane protein CFEM domain-containing protein n=1 Tax=Smittium simulii TaxID=133385 RepID=A0A2T9YWI6_9FUNG|nr:hypothetical protein BB561_001021 [Smittium simulii]
MRSLFFLATTLSLVLPVVKAGCEAEAVFTECVSRQSTMRAERCRENDLACQCYWYSQLRICFELCQGDETKIDLYEKVDSDYESACSAYKQLKALNPDLEKSYVNGYSKIPNPSNGTDELKPSMVTESSVVSVMPAEPSVQAIPAESAMPVMPVMPAEPTMPAESAMPVMPVMPAEPSAQAIPTESAMSVMPAESTMPAIPAESAMPGMPAKPVDRVIYNNKPVEPVAPASYDNKPPIEPVNPVEPPKDVDYSVNNNKYPLNGSYSASFVKPNEISTTGNQMMNGTSTTESGSQSTSSMSASNTTTVDQDAAVSAQTSSVDSNNTSTDTNESSGQTDSSSSTEMSKTSNLARAGSSSTSGASSKGFSVFTAVAAILLFAIYN